MQIGLKKESFFARHVYFSGDDKPYEKLKKALKAEIDESAWSTKADPSQCQKQAKLP